MPQWWKRTFAATTLNQHHEPQRPTTFNVSITRKGRHEETLHVMRLPQTSIETLLWYLEGTLNRMKKREAAKTVKQTRKNWRTGFRPPNGVAAVAAPKSRASRH